MQSYSKTFFALILAAFLAACGGKTTENTTNSAAVVDTPKDVQAPDFNADSAFAFVKTQVDFGCRVPGTPPHSKCADFIEKTLKKFTDTLFLQDFTGTMYDGKSLRGRNIFASINPSASKRILLAAHWDTRHLADQDSERSKEPIMGANDGGSGVAILLEIARAIKTGAQKPVVGIDLIFFDLEDQGDPAGDNNEAGISSWCLGSQYWSKNKHTPNYSAFYGILFDMVGAKGAYFYQEGHSMQYAPAVMQNVWQTADRLGFGSNFIKSPVGAITDDHYFVNTLAGIPMIDIIEHDASGTQFFGSYWHTHKDNMDIIDKNTLKAVGQTALQVLYNEKP